MKTQITKTIEEFLDSPAMGQITDRKKSIDGLIEEVKSEWTYDLFERKPAPAYMQSGLVKATNLDLASMISALADRNAVINIPDYESRRAKTKKSNEWVVSDKNRHGQLVGLTANREVFSFSARIVDQNVVNTETNETGAYRNFMLTDLDGHMYDGWNTIQIHPTAKENKFINERDIAVGNVILFKNFVTPQLWISFFGEPYIKLKALETRVNDEASYYRNVALQLKEGLHKLSKKSYIAPLLEKDSAEVQRGESIPIKVDAFKAEMDIPLHGEYPSVPHSRKGYEIASERARLLTYTVGPRLRFSSRAVELAYAKNGEGNLPGWKVPEIERGYIAPGKRTEWNRISFSNDCALRFRTYEKTERVNPSSV